MNLFLFLIQSEALYTRTKFSSLIVLFPFDHLYL